MFAIEIFMVARVMIAIVGEGCTAIAGEESKVEGKEKKKRIHDSRRRSLQNKGRWRSSHIRLRQRVQGNRFLKYNASNTKLKIIKDLTY